ncbi:MAG: hypothetical protein QOH71_3483 [Blastocatellia bacterium]|nr:hypothetical protein [Blastocatellia bacterium]
MQTLIRASKNILKRRPCLRKDLAAIGLLVLMVGAAFANVVFGGKSLIPSDNANPLDWRLSDQNYGRGFVPLKEWTDRNLVLAPNYRDPAASTLQMEPSREFLRRSLARGEFPFWDPYTGGGTPSFSTLIPAYLFPPSLAVVLLGNGSLANNVYILLLITCAGALTYFLLRHHGLSWPASMAGALAFMFSGAVIQTAPSGLGQPVVLFSLPLLVSARLFDRPGARRAAELALAFAFVALASFPPILMEVFGTCVVYLIVGLVLRPNRRGQVAGWFAVGILASVAIAGIAYIPALPVISAAPHISAAYSTAAVGAIAPKMILQLLSPTILGGSAIYLNPGLYGEWGGYFFYTGVVALFLCGIGFVVRAEKGARVLKITAIVVAGLATAKIIGLPPVQWVTHLPVLRNIHFAAYFGIAVAYAIAILAALGVDALAKTRARVWQVAASGAVLGVTLLVIRIQAGRVAVQLNPGGWRWMHDYWVLVLFAIAAVTFAFLTIRSTRAGRTAIALMVLVLATEGLTNSIYPRQQRSNIWSHPPRYVEILTERNSGGRVLPMPNYPANTGQPFGHPTLDSLTLFTSLRMFEFYQRYFSPKVTYFLLGTRQIPPERILDVANIEYLAIYGSDTLNHQEASARGYETLYADDFVHLIRRPTTPHYWLTSDYRVGPTKQAVLEALETLPAGAVLLEEQPGFTSRPQSSGQARVTHLGLNEVEIAVDSPGPALLVCSDSNMSGWIATVDEHPAPILAANYAFRAVEVPAGSHTVRLHYRPPGLYLGLLASGIGLLACLWTIFRYRAVTNGSTLPNRERD